MSPGVKIAGGCGIFGCLGVVVAGIVLALVVVLRDVSGSQSGPSPGRRDGWSAPARGSLKQIVEKQVGPYALSEVSAADPPKDLAPGMQEGLSLKYSGPGTVLHDILSYASAADANARLDALVGAGAAQPLKNKKGEVMGRIWSGKLKERQLVVWTHSSLVLLAYGDPPHAVKFAEAVPY
jgi:hypothetical protein